MKPVRTTAEQPWHQQAHIAHCRPSALCSTPRQATPLSRAAPASPAFLFHSVAGSRDSRRGQAPHCALFPVQHCVVSQVARLSRRSRLVSHRSTVCASRRTVVCGRREVVAEAGPVSAPPVKENLVTGRGHHVELRLAGGDLGDRVSQLKEPSALSRTLSKALDATVATGPT